MITPSVDIWYYLFAGGFSPADISGFIGWWKGNSIEIDGLTYLKDYSGNDYHALASDYVGYSDGDSTVIRIGGATVVSYDGTANVTMNDSILTITDGSIYNLLLSDGSFYPFNEGGVGYIYNVAFPSLS